MATEISIEAIGAELKSVLARLPSGESVTVVGADGKPVAHLYFIKPKRAEGPSPDEWFARWDAMAKEIGKAWKSEKSAVEIISEMRR